MRNCAFIHGPELDRYPYPPACPFQTHRAMLTRQKILGMGLLGGPHRREVAPVRASIDELTLFHTPEYIKVLERAGREEFDDISLEMGLGTPDCPIFKGLYDYSCWAAGASITGMKLLLNSEANAVFNPSGGYHHAHRSRASGFCYINDIVLACMIARNAGKKVIFLDIDVHHSDGVQEAFGKAYDVMTISMHESGKTLFPGTGFESETGEGAGKGYTVNIPLPIGTYDDAYMEAFRTAAWPLMQKYPSDIIVMEMGMDALAGDPLAHLHLTNNVHADILRRVLSLGKPLLLTGGGGYHVENTVRGWALAWSIMAGDDDGYDLSIGMGGVMLENTDWAGGLRDRTLISDGGRHDIVDGEIKAVTNAIRSTVFPVHGLA